MSHVPAYATAGFSTRALHVGSEPSTDAYAAVIPAISLSTTFQQDKVGVHKGFEYTRSANPTRLALERVLASLEGADVLLQAALIKKQSQAEASEKHIANGNGSNGNGAVHVPEEWTGGPAALCFSSGSAATATVISGLAGQDGHLISIGDVYGGTSRYMLGVAGNLQNLKTTFVDMSYPLGTLIDSAQTSEQRAKIDLQEDEALVAKVEKEIKGNTKLIWAETPTNPTLRLAPIALLAALAKKHRIPFVVDNTFASPFYQNPLLLGADIVVHSVTKYLNGHSDVLGGVLVTADPALLTKFRYLQNASGAVPSPFDSWLVIRGLKTLSLRLRQSGLSALSLATWLFDVGIPQGLVRDVYYPGLNRGSAEKTGERRERELAWAQMASPAKAWVQSLGFTRDGDKGFPAGGMLSFHILSSSEKSQEDSAAAEKFLEKLKWFALAESLGSVESLAELPLKMTHAGVAVERRRELGIDGELVRLSVGVEEGQDLRDDVEQALRFALKIPATVVVNGNAK